jgi:hypothetical protein
MIFTSLIIFLEMTIIKTNKQKTNKSKTNKQKTRKTPPKKKLKQQ